MQVSATERETGRLIDADLANLVCSLGELEALAGFFSDAMADASREFESDASEPVYRRYADSSSDGSPEDAALVLVVMPEE